MNNNNSKHQQLLRDRLFLERVFLLEIESCQNTNRTDLTSAPEPQWETDNSNDIRFSDGDTVSAPVPKRTIAPISFVSIYAIVVTLLLLLPSNSERANSKTIAAERENERISLLETKIQQLEAKTQTLSLEVTANYDQKSLPVVETIELVALPIQSTATKLEAIEQEPERGRGADNSTQQTTERLAPLPVPTPPSFTTQSPTQLPPIPVPAPPSFVSQTTSPLTFPPKIVRTVTAINTANLNSSSETESEPKLEIESEVIVSETTVIKNWINRFAEYGMVATLSYQSNSQVKLRYSRDYADSILSSCGTKIFFNTGHPETADKFSQSMGSKEVSYQSESRSYGKNNNRSLTEHISKAPLITGAAINRFGTGECVILSPGYQYRPRKLKVKIDKKNDRLWDKSSSIWQDKILPYRLKDKSNEFEDSSTSLIDRQVIAEATLPTAAELKAVSANSSST